MSKRPIGIWVVSLYFVVSVSVTLISLAQLLTGSMALTPEQRTYFASLGPIDYIGGATTLLLSCWAAIELFRLRKEAVQIFGAVLVLNLVASLYHLLATNWTDALGVTGLAGVAAGLSLLTIVFIYAWILQGRGVLS